MKLLCNVCRLSCLLILATAFVLAQETISISGVVRDPQGAVIPGATVALISRDNAVSVKTLSDRAGGYRFEHLLPGLYLLSASAQGLETSQVQTVDASAGSRSEADLHLRVAAVSATVSVTASGTAQTTDEIAKSITVVSSETISFLDKSTITDSLSYVPGLRIEQQGGPGGVVSIKTRGLRNQDTAVLIDGFRFRDAAATQGDASALLQDLTMTDVDRIEVLRGTGSSIYGTDATGGVVNIITDAGGGETRGSVLLEGGSLGTFRGRAGISGSMLGKRLGYSAGIAHLNVASGLDGSLPDRTSTAQGRFNLALSNNTHLTGRIFIADSFSRVTDSPTAIGDLPANGVIDARPLSNAELNRYEGGTPVSGLNVGDATFIPDADNPDYNRSARIYSGALSLNSHMGDAIGIVASYQGLSTHRNFDNGPLGVGFQPFGGNEIFGYDGIIHTATGRLDWRLGKYQSINAGYEFESENFYGNTVEPTPADNSTANVTQRNQALFVQDQFHLLDGRLQFAGSYRAQFFTLDAPSLQPSTSAPYASMSFSAPPTSNTWDVSGAYFFRGAGTKLRAHVGDGYRAPSLYERFGTFFSSFFGYSAYGNPELKPERSTAFEAGVDQSFWSQRVQASATYFYTRLHDVIVFGDIDPTTDPYGRFFGYLNTHGGIARGVETSVSIAPVRRLNVQAAYTFTNAREAAALVPGVFQTYVTPDHQFSILATGRVTPRITLIFGTVIASSYLAPVFDSVTFASRAYRFEGARHGQAGGSYRLPLGESSAVRFFANVENVFNQSYYESGYRTPRLTATSGLQFEF